MYLDAQGNVVPGMSLIGYKASGVPGSVAGLTYAQKHYGKLTLAQDMAPAIKLATEGYVLSVDEARALQSKNLTRFPTSAKIFQRDGDFYKEGDTFKQPELAATLTRIAARPRRLLQGRHGPPDRRLRKGRRRPHHRRRPRRLPGQGAHTHHAASTTATTSSPPHPHPPAASSSSRSSTSSPPTTSPNSAPTAAPPRSTSSPKPSAAPTWIAATTSATPTSTLSPSNKWPNPKYAAAWRSLHRPHQTHAQQRPRPPRRLHASAAPVNTRKRTHPNHPLLHRRRRRQRRLQHLHPQRRLRLRSHRRRPRLPHEQRDGRLHLQDRRPQHVRPHPELRQLHRPRQAPALRHDPHHHHHPRSHWYKHGKPRLRHGHPRRLHHHHHRRQRHHQHHRQRPQHSAGRRRSALPPPIPARPHRPRKEVPRTTSPTSSKPWATPSTAPP